jgi:ankyrin repeat protein
MRQRVVVIFAFVATAVAISGQEQPAVERFFQVIRNDERAELKRLITEGNPNGRDKRGVTPLMYAATYGTAEELELLIAAGADVNARNEFNGTPLICAAGDPVKSRILIEHGADVNARSDAGRTPLMVAARHRENVDLVRLLLAKGADARAVSAQQGSALLEAAQYGDIDVMRLLIDRGADVNLAITSSALTPLGNAVSSNEFESVKLLLAHGARVDGPALNDHGKVRNGRLSLGNLTALMLAAPYGSPALIDLLLKAGSDVNAKDERALTPLMLAVASETQDAQVVQRLLSAGADVNARSTSGETALDWADKFGNRKVIAVLKHAGAQTGTGTTSALPARPDSKQPQDAREALNHSVALLQHSSTEFFKKSGCVACHHQPMTAMAVAAARRVGSPIDEVAANEQLHTIVAQVAVSQLRLLQGSGPVVDHDLMFALALREADYRPDANTDALVVALSSIQQPDGSWRHTPALSRTPIEESDVTRTVEVLRALQVFAFPARKRDFDRQIAKAREWLLHVNPRTTDEHAMLLLGLSWTGADRQKIRSVADALITRQHADGGWAGNPNLASDAFATGEALYALRESGILTAADPSHRRGVQYLLRTQFGDGSWHVASRAVKFQPYFQSGFTFEHDQWISAAGTAWAVTAIAAELAQRPLPPF